MDLVCRRHQDLGVLRARQQLLEFLVLAWLGVDLGDTLEAKRASSTRLPCAREASSTRRTSLAAARDALKQARYASSASSAERPAHASTIAT